MTLKSEIRHDLEDSLLLRGFFNIDIDLSYRFAYHCAMKEAVKAKKEYK
jgi:hypothetical protein